eukprot:s1575_g16.t1
MHVLFKLRLRDKTQKSRELAQDLLRDKTQKSRELAQDLSELGIPHQEALANSLQKHHRFFRDLVQEMEDATFQKKSVAEIQNIRAAKEKKLQIAIEDIDNASSTVKSWKARVKKKAGKDKKEQEKLEKEKAEAEEWDEQEEDEEEYGEQDTWENFQEDWWNECVKKKAEKDKKEQEKLEKEKAEAEEWDEQEEDEEECGEQDTWENFQEDWWNEWLAIHGGHRETVDMLVTDFFKKMSQGFASCVDIHALVSRICQLDHSLVPRLDCKLYSLRSSSFSLEALVFIPIPTHGGLHLVLITALSEPGKLTPTSEFIRINGASPLTKIVGFSAWRVLG